MTSSEALVGLSALVKAHAQPHPRTGAREPIMYVKFAGGSGLKHHALERPARGGRALLEELSYQGYLDLDYRQHN